MCVCPYLAAVHVPLCTAHCALNPCSCRCFSFGIGSGVSTHLVKGIAEAGRGTAEFVTSGERMQPKVRVLIDGTVQLDREGETALKDIEFPI